MNSTISASSSMDIATEAIPTIIEHYNTLPTSWREYSVDKILENFITPIWDSRKRIELLFRSKTQDVELFNLTPDDPIANNVFISQCNDEREFTEKIQHLAFIITNLKDANLRSLIVNPKKDKILGSLNLLETLLRELYPKSDLTAIQTLRDIQTLRSKASPTHYTGTDYLDAMRQLGIEYPPTDWQKAWEFVLAKCKRAFGEIEDLLKI